MINQQVLDMSLVLEGGGMRGIFTAGVLDCFMDHGITFPYAVGVSAGATTGLSYVSQQPGRTLYADTTLMQDHPYIGFKPLLKRGEIIDMKLLFDTFPREIYPFDIEAFVANSIDFEMVTTDVETGRACYLAKPESWERLVEVAIASSSLPFINPVTVVDGVPMLDGGLADSIPLERARSKGYDKALVILTQVKGYRKRRGRFALPKFLMSKYPKVIELLNSRADRYNAQLEHIERLESEGVIEVLRPMAPMMVERLSTDVAQIEALHRQGFATAMRWLEGR